MNRYFGEHKVLEHSHKEVRPGGHDTFDTVPVRLNTWNSAFKEFSFVRRSRSVQEGPSMADYFSFRLLTFRRSVYVHAAQNFSPLMRQGDKKTLTDKFSLYQATSHIRDKRLITVVFVGVSVQIYRCCSQWRNFHEI
jgi:hypothetical protein